MAVTQPVLAMLWAIILAPFNFVLFPLASLFWAILKHTLLIPCLLIIRIALYGTVYLPLTLVFSLTNVHYDSSSPVEVSLLKILSSSWPHLVFLFVNLLHYLIVSVFIGVIVGVIAGTNMSIAGYLLTWKSDSKHVKSSTTQTTPFFNAKAELPWNAPLTFIKPEPQSPQLPNIELQHSGYPQFDYRSLAEHSPIDDTLLESSLGEMQKMNMRHFVPINEESEPDETVALNEEDTQAGLNPEQQSFSSVQSLFSKGQHGGTFSTGVSHKENTLQHKRIRTK